MADERDNDATEQVDEEPRGPQCGERLAAARAERSISVLEIAKELHVGEDKVEALERNEFDALGAAVFAKGYIRKYAKLVGMDEAELVAEYEGLVTDANVMPVVKARARPRREISPGPWVVLIVIIIVAASAYWWFVERPLGDITTAPPADPGPSLQIETPVDEPPLAGPLDQETAGDAGMATPGDEVPPTADEDDVTEASDSGNSTDEEAIVEPAAPADGQLRILLTFSGDCWTEISDGSGRRLFFGLGSDGRTVELSGQAPINALFGNAANVDIEVNGVAYAIRPEERRGRTARLTISGS